MASPGPKRPLGASLSTLQDAAAAAPPASPNPAELWMASSGRLRIGPDGVPLKFSLTKLAQAKALAAKVSSSSGGGGGSSGAEARAPEHKSLLQQDGAAAPKAAADGSGGGGSDKILSHHLQLLSALVGPEAVAELGLGCVFPSPCTTHA
jgi:hypothetical protein